MRANYYLVMNVVHRRNKSHWFARRCALKIYSLQFGGIDRSCSIIDLIYRKHKSHMQRNEKQNIYEIPIE